MSHNRHYILIKADNVDEVESKLFELNEYGNENNWWSIVQALDIKDTNNITDIQSILDYLNSNTGEEKIKQLKEYVKTLEEQTKDDDNSFVYWELSQVYKTMHELECLGNEKFTIDNLENMNDYFGYTYEEFGFTNMTYGCEGEHTYLVEIDMHS